MDSFVVQVQQAQREIYATAQLKGWWEDPREDGTLLMLMVGELAEAMEWLRKGNPPSDQIPAFSGLEEELADVWIRVLDYAEHRQLRVAEAVLAKMEYNRSRSYRHGGKEF